MKDRASWFHQFTVLLKRSFIDQWRSKEIFLTLLALNAMMGFLIGGAFWKIGSAQESQVKRMPVLFFCVINQGIFGALMTINSFPKERILVLRERAAGTYFSSAYFLAKNLSELMLQVIPPIMFSSIVYFMVGLQLVPSKFFIFMGFLILTSISATSLALMISTLCKTTEMAVTVLPLALEITRLFGGFFLSPANLPIYFSWLDALSYVKYSYVGIALNELTGLSLSCTDKNLVNGVCPGGEETIAKLGLNYISIGACAAVLIGMSVVFRVVAYLGLRFFKN